LDPAPDRNAASPRQGDARRIEGGLDAETSDHLARAMGGRLLDAFLTALCRAWQREHGGDSLTLLLEGHGREALFDDVDLSRTTGWFTSLFPVRLATDPGLGPAEALAETAAELARIPRRGVDFGILRYLGPGACRDRLAALGVPPVSLNYLGRFDPPRAGSLWAHLDASGLGLSQSPDGPRYCPLDVQILRMGEGFQIVWTYDPASHDEGAVARMSESFVGVLRDLAGHGHGHGQGPGPGPALGDAFPLTPTQEGVLFHAQLDRSGELYFEQLVFDIAGPLDIAHFRRAWEAALDRHAMLRTRFVRTERGAYLQEVMPAAALQWLTLDWSGRDPESRADDLAAFLAEDRTQPFVLDRAPLFRLALIRLAADAALLVWSHHHAVLDGWSVPLVLKDVLALYGAAEGAPPLLRPAAGFRDYIDWLETQRARPETACYWREALAGFRTPTGLPGDVAAGGAPGQQAAAEEVSRPVDPPLAERLRQLAKDSRVTVGTMMQGLWALLLGRATGVSDVVFGTTGSGRTAPLSGIDSLVGVFIQTLPVRVRIPETGTLIDFLRSLQAAHVEREAHGHCGLVAIQGWSEIPHGEPLFDSLVVVENYPVDAALFRETGGIRLGIRQARVRTNYPLTLSVVPGAGLDLTLSYDPARYSEAFCARVLDWLGRLVTRLAADPDQPLHGVDLLDADERSRILALFDRREASRPSGDTLVDLVERQAARTPEATALVHRGRETCYAAMEAAANRLARHLAGLGIRPETRVGLCLGRSDRTVIAILAIMKAGAAYVPLDPKYPRPRLELIADCAALTAIVTEAGCRTAVDGLHPVLVDLDAAGPALDAESDAPLPRTLGADDLAYVLFTSGSTGRPKGVAIPHRGGVTLMGWAARTYAAEELRGTLFSTSVNFDLSVFEIFAPLSTGGAVVVAETVLELPRLSGVTLVNTVPSAMAELLRTDGLNDSVRTVNLAGEALPRTLVDALYRCPSVVRVFNLYGPSETTTYSTGALLPRDSTAPPPIGVPLDGEAAYVLDAQFNLMPFGLAGELYLAGEGVARGYLFDPARTAEAFLPNPFARTPGERLYRTGDQARYRPDGEIDFLGRKDHQIKIRGFRLELGEIETALLTHDGVQEAAVTFHENPATGAFLAAHIVPADPAAAPEPADVRAHLRGHLPDHAVPRLVQFLPAMPMTPNGKKDRVRLAGMLDATAATAGHGEPAATGTETAVARIFARILQLEAPGRHESFFDLGGHSLLVTRLAFALRKAFGVELSLADVYARPTVAELAEAVDAARRLPVEAGPVAVGRAIRLNETEQGQPLYLVCPASGSPMCYRELAGELAGIRPVWGFEAPGLQRGEAPCRTVEALADHLLPALLDRHGEGPVFLGGWSFGGWVAFELARRLRRHGRDAVVLLIDPEIFGRPTADQPAPRWRDWWRRLRRELAGMRFDERFSYAAVRRFASWLGISLPASWRMIATRPLRDKLRFAGATGEGLLRSVRVFWTHYRANRRFRLSYLHADVHLFRTRIRSEAELEADPVYQGLKRTVSGHVGILPVPGTHLTLFERRNRAELARLIERQLALYGPAPASHFAIRTDAPAAAGLSGSLPPESQPVQQALFSSVDTRHEERKR
jgi:amino acid adenylation domain-containing protein/non-ribosomal peptide synthase protein (TIGR01720 family)